MLGDGGKSQCPSVVRAVGVREGTIFPFINNHMRLLPGEPSLGPRQRDAASIWFVANSRAAQRSRRSAFLGRQLVERVVYFFGEVVVELQQLVDVVADIQQRFGVLEGLEGLLVRGGSGDLLTHHDDGQ